MIISPFTLAGRSRIAATPAYVPRSGAQGKQTPYYERAPWLDMQAGGESFWYNNQIFPNAPGPVFMPTIGNEAIVVQFPVRPGAEANINLLRLQAVTGGWVDGSGAMVWRLQIDGLPAQGLNNILESLGSVNPLSLANQPTRARENSLVQLICRNVSLVTAPNTNPLIGIVGGFYGPIQQRAQGVFV